MFRDVYKDKKVFVTGHTGFKGSWLCAWLLGLGARVTGFSLDIPTRPAHFTTLNLADKMSDRRGDVRDAQALAQALKDASPEIVFHLAAQALVRPAYADPVRTFETNILGTLNILEACRHLPGIKAIVIITSDKCYKNLEWVWGYRENDRLGGDDPYSASKACSEIVANAYFQSYFKTGACCATTRAGNVIGGGDWAKDRIIPDCARAWSGKNEVALRSPNATRPWQLVLEPISGYLWLAANMFLSPTGIWREQAYNFGPAADVKHTVEEVVRALSRFWPDFRYRLEAAPKNAQKESGLLKLCCDKALAELDWKATLDFEETIRFTAEWYSRYYAKPGDMTAFSQSQIDAYCNLALLRGQEWAK